MWLAFGHRPRYLLHRAVRATGERRVVLPNDSAMKETNEEKATPKPAARPMMNFFVLSANAIALSLIVGLTLYLLDGGAERLMRLWWMV